MSVRVAKATSPFGLTHEKKWKKSMDPRMFEEWQIDKENFESFLDPDYVELPIPDELWKRIIDDVEGSVANYLDELLQRVALDVQEGLYNDEQYD
jgi:hypothetical protein